MLLDRRILDYPELNNKAYVQNNLFFKFFAFFCINTNNLIYLALSLYSINNFDDIYNKINDLILKILHTSNLIYF